MSMVRQTTGQIKIIYKVSSDGYVTDVETSFLSGGRLFALHALEASVEAVRGSVAPPPYCTLIDGDLSK